MIQRILKDWRFYTSLLALFFPLGWFLAQNSWNKDILIRLDQAAPAGGRNIASVDQERGQEINLPSSLLLPPGRLSQAAQRALLEGSLVEDTQNEIKISLARFLAHPPGSSGVLVCRQYKTVDIAFIAPSETNHGHTPQMTIKAPCRAHPQNPSQIGPFLIPKKQILNASPTKQFFYSSAPVAQQGIILFNHIGISWPVSWILVQLRFSHKTGEGDFILQFASRQPEDYITLQF